MFFPENINVGKSGYIAGQVNEVAETPGSVNRWLVRGCTIVADEPIIEPEIKEEIQEEIAEEVKKPVKATKKKTSRRKKK